MVNIFFVYLKYMKSHAFENHMKTVVFTCKILLKTRQTETRSRNSTLVKKKVENKKIIKPTTIESKTASVGFYRCKTRNVEIISQMFKVNTRITTVSDHFDW